MESFSFRVVALHDYMVTSRRAAQDARLSLEARGLLWLLLSNPEDKLSYLDDKYELLLDELMLYGYLRRRLDGLGIEVGSVPVQEPKERRKVGAKPKPKGNPFVADILKLYGGTKEQEYKDGLLGYKIRNWGKESAWARKIADDGYTLDDVRGCYEWLRSQKWRESAVSLATVYEQLGEYKRQNAPKTTERYIPSSLFIGDSDADSEFL